MARELEWKYRAAEAAFSALQETYGPFVPIRMETTYYDTQDLKLSFHQWTLRKRLENGVSVITFKRPLEDGSRGEWEVACDSIYPGIMALCQAGATPELMRCTAGGVSQLCGAKFTRLAAQVELPACTVELALDRGILTGRRGEAPIFEIEVEFKSGDEAAAAEFAKNLAREYGLEAEEKSKFVRALALTL